MFKLPAMNDIDEVIINSSVVKKNSEPINDINKPKIITFFSPYTSVKWPLGIENKPYAIKKENGSIAAALKLKLKL